MESCFKAHSFDVQLTLSLVYLCDAFPQISLRIKGALQSHFPNFLNQNKPVST